MTLSRNLLALLVVTFACYCAQSSLLKPLEKEPRYDWYFGSLGPSDVLLYSTVSTRNATVGSQVINDVVYRGFSVNITYITANENDTPGKNGTATLVSGGIGRANVTVRLTSQVSQGFNYTVSIYGK